MTDWLKEISNTSVTTSEIFAGDALNYMKQYFKDTDHASGDPSAIAKIGTETVYRSGKLNVWDANKAYKIAFAAPVFTENKTINIPSSLGASDTLLVNDNVAVVTNKTISYNSNFILDIPQVFFSAGGIAQFNGDNSTTAFNIAHGTGSTPTIFFANANSVDADGDKVVTADATNITVTFASAPPTGTNNVKLVWGAGYPTGQLADTLTGKTIGDNLTFDTTTTPSDPPSDSTRIWAAAIDANNDGMYAKTTQNSTFVTIRIF